MKKLFRFLFKPRCARCGARAAWVPGWCICQSCYDEQQQRPPAIALAS